LTSESKVILFLTGASHFSVHASMLIFPAIIITLKDYFNVGIDTLGWMYMLSSFMFGLGSIPAGLFEKKVGEKKLLILFQIGASISGLIIALANDVRIMTLGMMLLGLSASIYHPAGLTIISRRIQQTSKAMGFHGIAGSLGLAVGPLLAAWFSSTLDWRFAYLSMILLWLILAVLTTILIPEKNMMEDVQEKIRPKHSKLKPLVTYYIITSLIGLAFTGFITYMPVFFSNNAYSFSFFNDKIFAGGIATTIVLISGIPGQYFGGKWGHYYKKTRILFITCLLHIPLLLIFYFGSGAIILISGILLGFVHFTYQPIGNAMIAEYTSSLTRGIGYGFSFFLSFGVGSIASGIGGILTVQYGVSSVFLFVALLMLIATIISFFLMRIT
tara:strand:+ start:1975 stop:3132 length:1158 start_codon:yes stop_codon:yes gene_type:complete